MQILWLDVTASFTLVKPAISIVNAFCDMHQRESSYLVCTQVHEGPFKGKIGTILFLGKVQFASGEWIGLKLDEPGMYTCPVYPVSTLFLYRWTSCVTLPIQLSMC